MIYDAIDHKDGKLDHVLGSDTGGQAITVVGCVLKIVAMPVAMQLSQLEFMRDEHGDVHAGPI